MENKDLGFLVGSQVTQPDPELNPEFKEWLRKNNARDFGHPLSYYDYYGAFKAGINRAEGEDGHFPDTFKLPGHPTFSIESKYYRPGMAAGYWRGDEYVPLKPFEQPPTNFSILQQLFGVENK